MSDRAATQLAAAEQAVAARDIGLLGVGSSPEGLPGPFVRDDIELGLIESGARRTLAERLSADAALDLAAWARVAVDDGMSYRQVARLAAISHQRVAQIVGVSHADRDQVT